MLSRDLIATVVKTFHEELDDVRDGGRENNQESPYADLYQTYFSKGREWFMDSEIEKIFFFLSEEPIYKREMLAELLYRDFKFIREEGLRRDMLAKVLQLYEDIDFHSDDFSIFRMNREIELKKLLNI